MRIFAFLFLILMGIFKGMAQIEHPKISPFSEIKQDIGLTRIVVRYSRPGARERKVMGDLVPYHRVWRTGANASTTITVSQEISLAGKALPQGTYTLLTIPHEEYWEVIVNRDTLLWTEGNTYEKEKDIFRVKITSEALRDFQETFLITFNRLTHESAMLELRWEHTKISIPVKVSTQDLMRNEIEKKINTHPNAQTFYEAARYFQEQDIEYHRAMEFLEKAERIEGRTYYTYRIKALLLASKGMYKEAIHAAQESLIMATHQNKQDFVRMNKRSIDLWRSKL